MKKITMIIIALFALLILSSCDDIKPTKVKLLYSNTSWDEVKEGFIENYEDYLNSYNFLELEESFFETHLLYSYIFINNNQGKDIYNLKRYKIIDDTLFITIGENKKDISVDTAFGPYLLIFSISREFYKEFKEINISGIYNHDTILYQLTINDEEKLIINELNNYYSEGDELLIQTGVLYDVVLELYVNNEFHSIQTSVKTDKGYIWEYYLTMPNKDIEISFKVVDGFTAVDPIINYDYYMRLIEARMQFINEDESYNDYYGGSYINNLGDKYEYVICVYGDYIPTEYENITFKYVNYSYNYLLSIQNELTNFIRDYSIVSVGIDEKENKLHIQIKNESDVSLIIDKLEELLENFDSNSIYFDVNPNSEIIPI